MYTAGGTQGEINVQQSAQCLQMQVSFMILMAVLLRGKGLK
jgi:hypothetical protein